MVRREALTVSILDRLPTRLQWLRGRTGSIVAHWSICVSVTVLAHWALPWGSGAEIGAGLAFVFFGAREFLGWFLGMEDVDGVIEDLLGPLANLLYVLVL